jgi:beta-1,4-N-acetylglucosaminyltransferase
MHAFATVGSTKFDLLVNEILSSRTLNTLKDRGYTTLTVQCGNSTFKQATQLSEEGVAHFTLEGVSIEVWKFKPTLKEEYEKADLIISHAG